MELIETFTFTRQITGLLSDEDYAVFQSRLAANPGLGALIKGGGGIRKIRVVSWTSAARWGASASFTTGQSEGHPILLRDATPEERVVRSDPEAGGATRQGGQGGVQG